MLHLEQYNKIKFPWSLLEFRQLIRWRLAMNPWCVNFTLGGSRKNDPNRVSADLDSLVGLRPLFSYMITFTPLSGSANAQNTSPLAYLLQVDDVRILLDCGSPDWMPEPSFSTENYHNYTQSIKR